MISNERERDCLLSIAMEIRLYTMLRENRQFQRYRYVPSIKNSIHLSSRGGFMIVRQGVTPGREREGCASNHGKKSIHVCFHSLQKSCLPRVVWYIVQPVTCFVGCNNFPCSNRRESRALMSYHSSMAFLLSNILASCVIDVSHIALTCNTTAESRIKSIDSTKKCYNYLEFVFICRSNDKTDLRNSSSKNRRW